MPSALQEDLIAALSAVPEHVGDLLASVAPEQLTYRHGPAFPTLAEIVSHLATAGSAVDALLRHIQLDSLREINLGDVLEPPQPEIQASPTADQIDDLARVRRRTIDLLRGLPAETWQAGFTDVQRGPMSLADICQAMLSHELGHVSQVRNLLALVPEPTRIPKD